MSSPGLPLYDLSYLVEQFEENRTDWRSLVQYDQGLRNIIRNSNIARIQAHAVKKTMPPFASRFQDAHGSQQVRDLFRGNLHSLGLSIQALIVVRLQRSSKQVVARSWPRTYPRTNSKSSHLISWHPATTSTLTMLMFQTV